MSRNELYQKKALAKLNAPERQDLLFAVVPSVGWVALAAVVIAIFSALIWSVFGIMADKVSGYGIIVDSSGTANITPTSSGRVIELNFKTGDTVRKGDVVAVIEQSELEQNLYLQTEQAHDSQSNEDMASRAAQISSTKEQLHKSSTVVSPYDGTVIGSRLRVGDVVQGGTPLYDLRLNKEREDMLAVVYVPVLEGSRIKNNSIIQVSPGAVESSEYGSLLGRVISVSDYPVTSERMVYWTGNKELASWILQKNSGAAIEVLVELIKDSDTKSGYLWTSVLGPDEKIQSGMVCTANAVVKRQAPVVKAFNKLSQWLRSD
jgi:biotin carboxyl carrier protein